MRAPAVSVLCLLLAASVHALLLRSTAVGATTAAIRLSHRRHPPARASAGEVSRLNAIFEACGKGRQISREETELIRGTGGYRADRYGEITPKGFRALGRRLSLGPGDAFADCGSGLGMAVTQAVVDFNVSTATGVELSDTRHLTAIKELALQPDAVSSRVYLRCGDCADGLEWSPGGALHAASVVWACSELFNNDLMNRLARRISGSESVRAVATLRRFPGGLDGFRRQVLPEMCEMSWTAALSNPGALGIHDEHGGAPVHIYVRDR